MPPLRLVERSAGEKVVVVAAICLSSPWSVGRRRRRRVGAVLSHQGELCAHSLFITRADVFLLEPARLSHRTRHPWTLIGESTVIVALNPCLPGSRLVGPPSPCPSCVRIWVVLAVAGVLEASVSGIELSR